MLKLMCKKCNFEFEKEKKPEICPYCGQRGTVIHYKTAQQFLEESSY
jgi:rubrerythrin